MMTPNLYDYLKKEFCKMNNPKYHKYFEVWVANLTESQVHYFRTLWQQKDAITRKIEEAVVYINSCENVKKVVDSFDQFQKQRIYGHYLAKMLALKHDFVVNKGKFRHLWKDMHIDSYLEFANDKNYKVTDFGEDWKSMNVASRIRIDMFGIYDWYQKFSGEIKLN